MAENKGGRPPHQPTAESRKQVESMAGFGITAPEIALSLGITDTTLRKYYREEIDLGTIKANSAVAQSLYKKATGDGKSSVAAAIFWLKTRAGWKETVVNEHTSPDGSMTPKPAIDMSKLSDTAMAEILDAASDK